MNRIFLWFLSVLFLASCNTSSVDEGLLLLAKKNGINQLFSLSANGTLRQISDEMGIVTGPVLSPDKSKVAFMYEDIGTWNIFVYNIATGETNQVTQSTGITAFPAWSREGNKIAYMENDGTSRNIYVTHLNDGEIEQISIGESLDNEPLWGYYNPSMLYFKSAVGETESVNQYDVVIGEHTQITSGGSNEMLRQVPRKDQISFLQKIPNRSALWIYDEVTGELNSILETPSRISGYAWSNDGNSLAITVNSNLEIYKYDRDNGLMFAFTIEYAAYPSWSTSGQEVYYNKRMENGSLQIFKYNLRTSVETQMTHEEFDCTSAMPY